LKKGNPKNFYNISPNPIHGAPSSQGAKPFNARLKGHARGCRAVLSTRRFGSLSSLRSGTAYTSCNSNVMFLSHLVKNLASTWRISSDSYHHLTPALTLKYNLMSTRNITRDANSTVTSKREEITNCHELGRSLNKDM